MTIYAVFATLASLIAILSYIPYIRDVRSGKTRPHIFSWIVWSLMSLTFFFAQLSDNAGIGALMSGVTTILAIYIIIISLKQSDKSIKSIDYLSFGISILALLVWFFVKSPVYSVVIIAFSDLAALMPTVRKSYMQPHSETLITYELSAVKHLLNIFSLERITFVSSFYTFYLIGANIFLAIFLVLRRRTMQIANSNNKG